MNNTAHLIIKDERNSMAYHKESDNTFKVIKLNPFLNLGMNIANKQPRL